MMIAMIVLRALEEDKVTFTENPWQPTTDKQGKQTLSQQRKSYYCIAGRECNKIKLIHMYMQTFHRKH